MDPLFYIRNISTITLLIIEREREVTTHKHPPHLPLHAFLDYLENTLNSFWTIKEHGYSDYRYSLLGMTGCTNLLVTTPLGHRQLNGFQLALPNHGDTTNTGDPGSRRHLAQHARKDLVPAEGLLVTFLPTDHTLMQQSVKVHHSERGCTLYHKPHTK